MQTQPKFVTWFCVALPACGLLLASLFVLFLAATDEWRPIMPSSLSDDPPKLWGPLFGQQYFEYRMGRIARLRPEVIMLGSSRGGQFRAQMFPGAKFYNASLAATSLGASITLLESIVQIYKPRLVILPIDTWWFNPKWNDACADDSACQAPNVFSIQELVSATVKIAQGSGVFQDVFRELWKSRIVGKWPPEDPVGHRAPVGFLAHAAAEGFRPDGSYQYGRMIRGNYDLVTKAGQRYVDNYSGFQEQMQPSAAGRQGNRFGTVAQLPAPRIAALERFLQTAQQNGVEVILMLPPFAPGFMALVHERPLQAEFFSAVSAAVRAAGEKFHVASFDRHDFDGGLGDIHFYDGVHGDEHVHLALVRDMIKSGPLAPYVDNAAIEGLAAGVAERGDREFWLHLIAR